MKHTFLSFLLLLVSLYPKAQPAFLPVERTANWQYEAIAGIRGNSFHSSIKPLFRPELKNHAGIDSMENSLSGVAKIFRRFSGSTTPSSGDSARKYIEIFPLFYLHAGYESSDSGKANPAGSAIGAMMNAAWKEKLFFNAGFLTANASYPSFLKQYIDSMGIVPGEGVAFGTKAGYHYKNLSGYFSYSPSKIFNFQLGHGKNFLGDGYRSLLLSDAAGNYSFFKITAKVWKIKYVNLFANFKDLRGTEKDYWHLKDKYGTFHYLSWNVAKWFSLGLFESVIWQGKDTLNNRGFDVNYLNPVIFYRPVEYSLGSTDNSLMGLNLKVSVTRTLHLYGQLVIDEFLLKEIRARSGWWANKYGGQFGIKYFDAFSVKGLSLLAELNEVRPYTYSHGSSLQNYAHFNQPLAHPLGANFSEIVGILRYDRKRFAAETKTVISKYGADPSGKNYGGDIYKPYTTVAQIYGNKTGQGIAKYLMTNELTVSYLIFPKLNLRAEGGALLRANYFMKDIDRNLYVWIGVKTAFYNLYRDFM